jgi:hypothetical protein
MLEDNGGRHPSASFTQSFQSPPPFINNINKAVMHIYEVGMMLSRSMCH